MDAKHLVKAMTIEEKAGLCSGQDFWHTKAVERLGVPAVMVADGPHGLRKQPEGASDNLGLMGSVPATCFPPASTTACSFDEALLRQVGAAIGEEALQEGVSTVLGPGINIKRSPLCGRNFEYISEDPLVAGRLGAAMAQGIQSTDVGTSLKHFAANNQETWRLITDAVVDERCLREIYLAGFETVVKKARPQTVMCAYNRLNGVYACQNHWLLTEVLRGEWGFEGIVMTDWGAMDDRVAAAKAGLDLEMPGCGGANDGRLVDAVRKGRLRQAQLDTLAERMVLFAQKGAQSHRPGYRYDAAAHNALARRAAAESVVLLQNQNNLLPLVPGQRLAVIGAFAKAPRYQGTGSSKINPLQVDNAHDALVDAGFRVTYAPGYTPEGGQRPDAALLREACAAARAAEVAVVFVGLPEEYESEGFDRKDLCLPVAHNRLVAAVAAANPNTVVVLQHGAPVALPWRGKVAAILAAYLGGQAGGGAVADVLGGVVNPGGHLAETWPACLEDTPCHANFPGMPRQVQYRESIFVGYRWYETAGRKPAYPFGFGLSYTRFSFGGLAVSQGSFARGQTLTVRCTVKNTGARAGAEVAQLYIARKGESAIPRPVKELKGFAKLHLAPGQRGEATFTLDTRSFAYYNTASKAWCLEGGEYEILVGASSADIRLRATISVEGDGAEKALAHLKAAAQAYFALPARGTWQVPDAAFHALYGGPLPAETEGRPFNRNSTLADLQLTLPGRLLLPVVNRFASAMFREGRGTAAERRMALAMVQEIPLRTLGLMTGGAINLNGVDGLIDIANRRRLRGLARIVKRKQR